MKILIDINHPAHVHYFKNFIKIMEKKGHKFLIISRNKEIEHYLLKKYNIPFIDRGKGGNGKIGKTLYFFKAIYLILKNTKKFKPDVVISFGTPYPAIASWLLKIPHISFNDTEHAKMHHLLTDPFSKYVLTPICYNKDLGKKQIRFNGSMEMCYLHPKYFKPDPSVLDELGLTQNDNYFLLRFSSFRAVHDSKTENFKKEYIPTLIKKLEKEGKIIISSEDKIYEGFEKYQYFFSPDKYHSLLYYSKMYIGEGSTSAEEAAILGVPSIHFERINRKGKQHSITEFNGELDELQNKYKLIYSFYDEKILLRKVDELFKKGIKNTKLEWIIKKGKYLNDKIDVTQFIVWFIENYPESVKTMKENPEIAIKT